MMTERECMAHVREYHSIEREHARIKAARKVLGRRIAKLNATAARERQRNRRWLSDGQSETHRCPGMRLRP
jgi:hypothetical protein